MTYNNKAPTPCLETGCPLKATYQGRCDTHKKQWEGSTRKQRLPQDWNTRRAIVLKKGGGVCYLCGGPNADTVDHIVEGDNHSLDNLAPVHDRNPPHCHRYKTGERANEIKKGYRIKQTYKPI
jgi:5-methylcytosine-specific restriction enzyme A